MDDRARTTDSVLLLIILNILYDFSFLIEAAVVLYFAKNLIVFFGNFYILYKKN